MSSACIKLPPFIKRKAGDILGAAGSGRLASFGLSIEALPHTNSA